MKKLLVLAGSTLILVSGIFVACKKTGNSISKEQEATQKRSMTAISGGYDLAAIGKAHNDYLDYLTTKPDFDPNDKEANYEYGKGYEDMFSNGSQNISWEEYQPNLNYTKQLVEDIFNGNKPSERLLRDNKVSVDMAAFLDNLASVYQSAFNMENETYYSIQEFTDAVNQLEDKIKSGKNIVFNMNTLEANDNAAKIAICEIAKSSYSYWIGVAEGSGNNGWNNNGISETTGFFGRIWHGIKVGAADSYGFVVGGWDSDSGWWHSNVALQSAREGSAAV